ncbi:hypothetical protein ACIQWI_04895 [Peribacillus frigoritolerans]
MKNLIHFIYNNVRVKGGVLLKNISLLLMLLLVLPYFISYKIVFLGLILYLLIQLIFYRFSINFVLLGTLLPLILIFFIGLLSSIYGMPFYNDLIRDIIFYLMPILLITTGYIISIKIKDISLIINTVVWSGIILSVYHLHHFVLNPSLLGESIRQIRLEAGLGFTLTILSLFIIYFSKSFDMKILNNNIKIKTFGFIVCSISGLLSFSRSLIIFSLVILLILSISKRKYVIKSYLSLAITIFMILILIPTIHFSVPEEAYEQMSGKLVNSLNEVSITEFDSIKQINENWRGYEAYRSQIDFLDKSFIAQIFGGGFGERIPLGLSIQLSGEIYTSVPIVHNGFWNLLNKVGVSGLLLYIVFIISILKLGLKLVKKEGYQVKLIGYFSFIIAAFVFISTLLATGLYKSQGTTELSILIGLFIGIDYCLLSKKIVN